MDEKNDGFEASMFMLLIVGYLFFIIYFFVIVMVILLLCRRFRSRQQRINSSAAILNSISKIKFTEDLFGALNAENECIICMCQYQENDLITRLNCNPRHFFHTSCIEQWIKGGNNKCPMCRKPILERSGNQNYSQSSADSDLQNIQLGAQL